MIGGLNMVNPTLLYSYKGSEPDILPHRIRLSSGMTRTDNTTFTEEELLDVGFFGPYEKPEETENVFDIIWDNQELRYVIVTKEENELNEFRNTISSYISHCDWTVSEDSPLPENLKDEWIEYRKKLEIIKDNPDYKNIILPNSPSYEY